VAKAQIGDGLSGKPRKGRLIGQRGAKIRHGRAGFGLQVIAPEVKHPRRAAGQRAPGCKLADHIARRDRQWRAGGLGDVGIALARRILGDAGIDVASRPGHVPRAHRLAAGGFHRLVKRAAGFADRRKAGMGGIVVIAQPQRQRIGGAAGAQHLVARHPPADLGQPHLPLCQPRRIDGIGHTHLEIARQRARRFGQRLLERVGGVVVGGHGGPFRWLLARRRRRPGDRDQRIGAGARGIGRSAMVAMHSSIRSCWAGVTSVPGAQT
jgi:hypothetical protein